jgi:hypothetical protein
VAGWAKESNLPMLPRIVSGLAENTNSIFCDGPRARYSEWMSGSATAGCPVLQRQDVRFCNGRNHSREAQCELVVPRHRYCALLKKRASRDVCFLLTNDLLGCRPLRESSIRIAPSSTSDGRIMPPTGGRGSGVPGIDDCGREVTQKTQSLSNLRPCNRRAFPGARSATAEAHS